ncbi:gamma-glutamyltransferase 7 [Platysternon megacephalum]|uniref:Gamma-glutamyltransferase 7 n=1 Tax=Platysternon megacephalum TaxID=55544 RepID=A0A4D9E8Q6_9SAUR|nr:gamma-glutamyltransferase 7 [Platysternon megacephalum]
MSCSVTLLDISELIILYFYINIIFNSGNIHDLKIAFIYMAMHYHTQDCDAVSKVSYEKINYICSTKVLSKITPNAATLTHVSRRATGTGSKGIKQNYIELFP